MSLPIISILVCLVIVGVVLFLVNKVLPAPEWIKTTINVLAALFILLYLLNVTGLWTGFHAELR